jgi:PKD repeat protein
MRTTGIWLFLVVFLLFIVPASADQTPPVAAFTSNMTTGNAPLTIQFIDASGNSPASWTWTFGDGSSSTAQNPVHTYLVQGTYTVSLTVTNPGGSNSITASNYITAIKAAPPAASFSANKTTGTVPFTVNFTDISTNTPSAWAWTFGDGGWAITQHPQHTYTTPGSYPVSLTVTNNGGSNTNTVQNYITVIKATPPVVSFAANSTSGAAPLLINFTDGSSNTPTAWSWDFGDGGSSTQQNPQHTYTSAGTFGVTLTASNYGGSNSITRTNYILITGQTVPVASFTANRSKGPSPLAVNFSDASSNAPIAWLWTFGDGSSSTDQYPTHTYTSAGQYTVALTATNYGGNHTVTISNFTTVYAGAPVASFVSDQISGQTPFTVSFSDTSTNKPTSWSWSFGDGTTSDRQNPSHTYSAAGTYSVSLIASNEGGSDSMMRSGYITATAPRNQVVTQTATPVSTPVVTATPAITTTVTTTAAGAAGPDLSSYALPAIVVLIIGGLLFLVLRGRGGQPGHHHRDRDI